MTPSFDNGLVQLYQADARELPLKDGTVHCCVTSPPYFGLRVYQTDDDRVLGLETSIGEYIANLVDVFREVWRVMRDDGCLWINMGDSYAGSGKGHNKDGTHAAKHGDKQDTNKGTLAAGLHKTVTDLADGNLFGVPWRLALALQDDGWILRDAIIWAKKSPMPESLAGWRWERCRVKVAVSERGKESWPVGAMIDTPQGDHIDGQIDGSAQWADCPGCAKCQDNDGLVLRKGSWRCTSSYELIFMLVKNMSYWADGEAVKVAFAESTMTRLNQPTFDGQQGGEKDYGATSVNANRSARKALENLKANIGSGANRRNVWRDIHSEPYPGEHYATFPPDLPRLCIQASTSEQGCCLVCGSQITRVIEKPKVGTYHSHSAELTEGRRQSDGGPAQDYEVGRTTGWRPSCVHTEATERPEPCMVLDPFMGTGTTALAAMRLGRRCVGTDLSEEYIQQASARLSKQTLPLLLA